MKKTSTISYAAIFILSILQISCGNADNKNNPELSVSETEPSETDIEKFSPRSMKSENFTASAVASSNSSSASQKYKAINRISMVNRRNEENTN